MRLIIDNVSKTYDNNVEALKNVSLEIENGMFGLLGPNGAGKSTLMRTIAGLQDADAGTIKVGDIDVKSDIDYLGKKALIDISKEGIKRKIMGVKIDLDKIEMTEERLLQNGKSLVGHLRSAVYSPHFKKVVGIAMIKKEYWDKKTTFELEINGKKSKGSVCDLPLV